MSQFFPPPGWIPPQQGGYPSPYVPPGNWSPPPPPPEPVGAALPPVRGLRAGTLLAWIVIVASVTVVAARYAVGVQAFTKSAPRAPATRATVTPATTRAATPAADLTAKLLDQLETTAQSPVDQFRAIPVVGELLGPDAAHERLDRFEREHSVIRLRRDVDLLRAIYTRGPASLYPSDRQYLIDRHGWFAQLALSHDAPNDDALRRHVLATARRTAALLLSIVVAGIAAFAAGCVLL